MRIGNRNIRFYAQPFNGVMRVHIRRFSNQDRPTQTGVALTLAEWSELKALINCIDEDVERQLNRRQTQYQRQNANQAVDPEFDADGVLNAIFHSGGPPRDVDENANCSWEDNEVVDNILSEKKE